MLNLTTAALFLIGTHFGIASTSLRAELVARIGEGAYRAVYSLLALVALVWLVTAWRAWRPDRAAVRSRWGWRR